MAKQSLQFPLVQSGIEITDIHQLDTYRHQGGYEALSKARHMAPEEVIDAIIASGLTGRGGAGFPSGVKWRTAAQALGVPVVVINGDESEPGSFKDRELMEKLPHRIIEGALIAAHAVEASQIILFIRGEYEHAYERLQTALQETQAAGLIGLDMVDGITLHKSAGAYICGEETALIAALEGERPMPRSKPPFPAVSGLNGRPTVVNNVETVANLPAIIGNGPEWFRLLGMPDTPGTRVFSLSGNVRHPGNYECQLGLPLIDLIENLGGGVPGNRSIKAVIPGGTSSPMLTGSQLAVRLEPKSLSRAGSMLGTASVIVYDDSNCMVDVAANMAMFYRDESCGKCTPCREGTFLMHEILTRIESGKGNAGDLNRLEKICHYIPGESVCAFGDAAVAPVAATLHHFHDEYQAHIALGHCPLPRRFEVAGQCFPVVPNTLGNKTTLIAS
jgi:NADH-quinone oxidoreductase subunit F